MTDLWSAFRAMWGSSSDETCEDEEEEPMPVAVICFDLQLNVHGMR